MPELPEVETIVNDLRPRLVGRTIQGVEVGWPGTIAALEPAELTRRLVGKRVVDIARRGKNIIIWLFGGEALLVHLRMSGRLGVAESAEEPGRFQRIALCLDNGTQLRFADLRKFGRVRLVPAAEVAQLDVRLGPEPLGQDFTPEALRGLLGARRGHVKPLLLDQSFLAGLGNIYADETLFAAGIHPHRIAASLTGEEVCRLHAALRAVLGQGVADRGTTFSDYRDGYGQPGAHQNQLMVYRRTGQPCRRCGAPIERLRFGGRGTHFCPRCQLPAPESS